MQHLSVRESLKVSLIRENTTTQPARPTVCFSRFLIMWQQQQHQQTSRERKFNLGTPHLKHNKFHWFHGWKSHIPIHYRGEKFNWHLLSSASHNLKSFVFSSPSSRFTFNFIFGQFQLVVVGEQRDTCNLERKLFVDFCDYDAHRWWRATRNSKLIAALIADGFPTV